MALDLHLGGFSDEKFDSKKWVNSVCKALGVGKDGDEAQNLSDLEMKLQLMADDISAALEEQSAPAIRRVPRANRDILRLREDVIALRFSLSSAMQSLSLSTVCMNAFSEDYKLPVPNLHYRNNVIDICKY